MPGPHRRGEHGEHGIAMVTAILISAVVLVFMVAALGLAVHSTSSSGADRSRTQAVHAAEAGVHRTISQISTLGATGLPCGTVSGTVNTAPQGSYAATITYFSTYPPVAGTEVDCTLWGSTPPAVPPRGATIRSQGTARADGALARTMQTQVRFADPIFGPFSNAAIYSASDLTLPNNLTVQGDSSADADIYIDGNLVCENNITVNGSVYPQGSATLGNTCKIDRDLWALDAITMNQSSRVVRNATSSTSSISLNNSSRVDGNATAGTTCAGCSGRVGGTVTVSSPQGPPPSIAPALDYDAAAWTAAGWAIETFTSPVTACTAARAYLEGAGAGTWGAAGQKTVVRIDQPGPTTCQLDFTNNATVDVRHDLAIISDGLISTTQRTTFNDASAGTPTVHFIVPDRKNDASGPVQDCLPAGYGESPPRKAGSTIVSPGDIYVGNLTLFSGVKTFFYTPCKASFNNNNAGLGGSVYGGAVSIANLFALTYSPIVIPGAGDPTGYEVDIAFLREIIGV